VSCRYQELHLRTHAALLHHQYAAGSRSACYQRHHDAQNSVIEPIGTPPPNISSIDSLNVMMGFRS